MRFRWSKEKGFDFEPVPPIAYRYVAIVVCFAITATYISSYLGLRTNINTSAHGVKIEAEPPQIDARIFQQDVPSERLPIIGAKQDGNENSKVPAPSASKVTRNKIVPPSDPGIYFVTFKIDAFANFTIPRKCIAPFDWPPQCSMSWEQRKDMPLVMKLMPSVPTE